MYIVCAHFNSQRRTIIQHYEQNNDEAQESNGTRNFAILRMEDFVSCNICAQVFDSLHFIPKILKCGHTFCSPCLIKLLQENPYCPNCRIQLKEIEKRKMDIATEVAKRKDIILKKKTQMTLNLEELTVSQSERIDTENTRKILDEIDEDLTKTDDVRSDDIKSSISSFLSSFRNSEQFLLMIYKRLQNGEKVFAVHKINEDFKYGEVSFFSNQLFFHCLSLSKVPKDSFSYMDVKQCLNYKSFCTFIKICCNEKNVTPFVIIETFEPNVCAMNSLSFVLENVDHLTKVPSSSKR
ncbi:hypothetical protein Avbf_13146 [Armadillidium vulgare]|nr:hypothetical protein Avbf_13146 [Armadillidium vulgare]